MDKLENFRRYQRSIPELWDVIRFVDKVKKENLPKGKYSLGKGFALVQEDTTRDFSEADFETHEKYLDVQILLSGKEAWEYAPRENLSLKEGYNPDTDISWWSGEGSRIKVEPGMFYVLYPEDGHKACCHDAYPSHYKKIVVKIKIDRLVHGVNL